MELFCAFSAGGVDESCGGSVEAIATPTRLTRGVSWLCLCVMSA